MSLSTKIPLYHQRIGTDQLSPKEVKAREKAFTPARRDLCLQLAEFDKAAKKQAPSPQLSAQRAAIQMALDRSLSSPVQLLKEECESFKGILNNAGIDQKACRELTDYLDQIQSFPEKSGEKDKTMIKLYKAQQKVVQELRNLVAKQSSGPVSAAEIILCFPPDKQRDFIRHASSQAKYIQAFTRIGCSAGQAEAYRRTHDDQRFSDTQLARQLMVTFLCQHKADEAYHPREVITLNYQFGRLSSFESVDKPVSAISVKRMFDDERCNMTTVEKQALLRLYKHFEDSHPNKQDRHELQRYLATLVYLNTRPFEACRHAIQNWDRLAEGYTVASKAEDGYEERTVAQFHCEAVLLKDPEFGDAYRAIKAEVEEKTPSDESQGEARVRVKALNKFVLQNLEAYLEKTTIENEKDRQVITEFCNSLFPKLIKVMERNTELAAKLLIDIGNAGREVNADLQFLNRLQAQLDFPECEDIAVLVKDVSDSYETQRLTFCLFQMLQARTYGDSKLLQRVRDSKDPKVQMAREQALLLSTKQMSKELNIWMKSKGIPSTIRKMVLEIAASQDKKAILRVIDELQRHSASKEPELKKLYVKVQQEKAYLLAMKRIEMSGIIGDKPRTHAIVEKLLSLETRADIKRFSKELKLFAQAIKRGVPTHEEAQQKLNTWLAEFKGKSGDEEPSVVRLEGSSLPKRPGNEKVFLGDRTSKMSSSGLYIPDMGGGYGWFLILSAIVSAFH